MGLKKQTRRSEKPTSLLGSTAYLDYAWNFEDKKSFLWSYISAPLDAINWINIRIITSRFSLKEIAVGQC